MQGAIVDMFRLLEGKMEKDRQEQEERFKRQEETLRRLEESNRDFHAKFAEQLRQLEAKVSEKKLLHFRRSRHLSQLLHDQVLIHFPFQFAVARDTKRFL